MPRLLLQLQLLLALLLPWGGDRVCGKEGAHAAKDESDGLCSNRGGWPAFERHGKAPAKARDLTFCQGYRDATCCGKAQTDAVRRLLYFAQETSSDCRDLWAALKCSGCDPRLATQQGPTPVSELFCDRLYSACRDDFVAVDERIQELRPCHGSDTLCFRASDWIRNGTNLCEEAGYLVTRPSSSPPLRYSFDGSVPKAGGSARSSSRFSRAKNAASAAEAAAAVAEEMPAWVWAFVAGLAYAIWSQRRVIRRYYSDYKRRQLVQARAHQSKMWEARRQQQMVYTKRRDQQEQQQWVEGVAAGGRRKQQHSGSVYVN